jgi:HptB-dependent secretion and biofilm anti anti-sigma factor
MNMVQSLNAGTFNLTLSGKFTFADHPEFREILAKIGEDDVRQIVLQMSGVEFVDSAALGMLLLARDEAEKHNKSLILSGATGQVKKMFEMAKFSNLFTIN